MRLSRISDLQAFVAVVEKASLTSAAHQLGRSLQSVSRSLAAIEQDVGKITKTFEPNPKENLPGADYGSSQKIWQNKADFDSKIPAVLKALADAKTSMKDVDSTKVAWDNIDAKCNACHDDYRLKLK